MFEGYPEYQRKDARLVMLRALNEQDDDRLNETMLLKYLENFGYRKTRDFVRTELEAMKELGAVILHTAPGADFVTAEITERGTRHCERLVTIAGIARPSRREG
ncbi:hypothetical protein DYI37_11470 [Fulvimarina endophytica]|uniref:Uncharacterized protein n=1 Tax=Fulvimarina endophytica TaxID=2293836 RepID=A0A371X311_9HYPH|nr:hypothetical protein [Fulvimarina endophytica]RFC63617.1 hypothetical protein DYI37_11470 [Fulvimarina endophytica]